MLKDFGKKYTELRVKAGLSQRGVADRLERYGVYVSNQAVSKWETGATQPNARQFVALCAVLGVDDISRVFGSGAGRLAGLNEEGRRKVAEYVTLLKRSGMYEDVTLPDERPRRVLPLYVLPASAGTGQFLDSGEYELVSAEDDVPDTADFGVRLSGDSMEPRFFDGDVVWVEQDFRLKSGDIGIFLYDGSAYCKRLDKSAGGIRLMSENPAYAPIEIGDISELRVFGKVLARRGARD